MQKKEEPPPQQTPPQDTMMKTEETMMIEKTTAEPLPESGGPEVGAVLLPAATLLVGSGILAYAVLRRR